MATTSRREFLTRAAALGAAGLLASGASERRANPLGLPIGSQVYPLRSMLKDLHEFVQTAADEYNRIAAVAAKAGMQQGLHNEGFELSMVDGKRTYDLLLDLLDPQLVKFQFQMSTITAGFVAADYFLKYPGRFSSMHLQDVDMNAPAPAPSPKGAPVGRRGGRHPQVAMGEGTIDWVKTFTAAKTGGVKNYFVEQSWELTKQSVAYLKTLKV